MALTKQEHEEILKSIVEGSDLNDELLNHIQTLRNEFTETVDGGDEWQAKYTDLKEKYTARFFSEPDETTTDKKVDKVKKEQKKDVERDGEEITYDDLFKKREV